MQILVAEASPPTLSDRAKFAGYGLLLLAAGIVLFWLAPILADPSWTPSTRRLRYLMDWPPFWRGAQAAIVGSWLVTLSLV